MGFGKVNTSNSRHFDISIGPNEEGVKFRQMLRLQRMETPLNFMLSNYNFLKM